MTLLMPLLLSLSTSWAAGADNSALNRADLGAIEDHRNLYGEWSRALDGCRQLSDEEIIELRRMGGGNGLMRSMTLTLSPNKFIATILPSPRCDADFKPWGMQSDREGYYCTTETNEGRMDLSGSMMILKSNSMKQKFNPWGIRYQRWNYQIVGGILVLRIFSMKFGQCEDGPFYVYFVRPAGA